MLPVPMQDLNQAMRAGWNTGASSSPSTSAPSSTGLKKKTRKTQAIPLNSPALEMTDEPIASSSTLPPSGTSTPPVSTKRARTKPPVDSSTLSAKYAPPALKLSNMAGLDSQIQQLVKAVILPLVHPNAYRFVGGSRPGGVLLHGVPGGGKTQLVRCLAGVSTFQTCQSACLSWNEHSS